MLITELNTKMNRETRRDYIGSVHKLDNEIVQTSAKAEKLLNRYCGDYFNVLDRS